MQPLKQRLWKDLNVATLRAPDNLMAIAYHEAARSSGDPRTKVGAVLLAEMFDKSNTRASWGWKAAANSTLCGRPHEELGIPRLHVMDHAEERALHDARRGISHLLSRGATVSMAVTEVPCPPCARSIVREGVHRVFVSYWWQRHAEHFNETAETAWSSIKILRMNGVEVYLDPTECPVVARRDDRDFVPCAEFIESL